MRSNHSQMNIIDVKGTPVSVLAAKDGGFFTSDWLHNRKTLELLGIWESVFNPSFNYGEFAIIKSRAGLNNDKLSCLGGKGHRPARHRPSGNFPGQGRALCSEPAVNEDIRPRIPRRPNCATACCAIALGPQPPDHAAGQRPRSREEGKKSR